MVSHGETTLKVSDTVVAIAPRPLSVSDDTIAKFRLSSRPDGRLAALVNSCSTVSFFDLGALMQNKLLMYRVLRRARGDR